MCTTCGLAIDDHPGDGSCPHPAQTTLAPPSSITLLAVSYGLMVPVDMPSATHGRYAAKRVAEALHLDPDYAYYWLCDAFAWAKIAQEEPIAPFNGHVVILCIGPKSP